ncbi:MAG TPA: sterol desaturase family protein [Gemmatimonadales bacterium]|nr:sterol desaturase family protein [Gemmatimonadales bacterium]
MSVVQVMIPVLLGVVALELVVGQARGRRVYRVADSLADLGCGAMSQVVGIAVTAVSVGTYALTADLLAVQRWLPVAAWPAGPLGWIAVFLLVDLGQYLTHRLSHRVALLWACHAVHHSSEELNYAVALRNSSFHGFFMWVFFLPLAVAGVPWRMAAVCYGLNVVYQFWLHTRLVGRLGWLERVLNTPSHHRVHHGRDAHYLDRNFGGVLIVWDRLFGTFTPEAEEPRYGTVHPPESWNPLWANVHGFALIAEAVRRAPNWRGRLRAVFGPPEQLAGLVPAAVPPAPSPARTVYAGVQLTFAVAATLLLVLPDRLPPLERLAWAGLVLVTLCVMGGLLDGRRWALVLEPVRLAVVVPAALLAALGPVP